MWMRRRKRRWMEKEKEKVDEKEEVKEDYLWVGHQQQKCHILLHRGHSNM